MHGIYFKERVGCSCAHALRGRPLYQPGLSAAPLILDLCRSGHFSPRLISRVVFLSIVEELSAYGYVNCA
jgi:hypothetical protein